MCMTTQVASPPTPSRCIPSCSAPNPPDYLRYLQHLHYPVLKCFSKISSSFSIVGPNFSNSMIILTCGLFNMDSFSSLTSLNNCMPSLMI